MTQSSVKASDLIGRRWFISNREYKISMVATRKALRPLRKIIGLNARFTQHNTAQGAIRVSTGFGDSHGMKANKLYKIVVQNMFPEMADALDNLEVEHKRNSKMGLTKEKRHLNQAIYCLWRIAFYTKALNQALVANQCETPTAGVSLNRLQAKYRLMWLDEPDVFHPLVGLSQLRKPGNGRKNTKPLRSLEFVHKERIDAIHEYHFSEERMKIYRSSLHFVKRDDRWFLERMADEDIKNIFRKRYKIPKDKDIEKQRQFFIEQVPIQREKNRKALAKRRAKKRKAASQSSGTIKLTKFFKPSA
jgi:hypothetical protein